MLKGLSFKYKIKINHSLFIIQRLIRLKSLYKDHFKRQISLSQVMNKSFNVD